MNERIIARLQQNTEVDATTGCWNWTGYRLPNGYGRLSLGGHSHYAHRLAYEAYHGLAPSGMCVCHTCDNPRCIRPDHLWLGSQQDNIRDRDAKGRTHHKGRPKWWKRHRAFKTNRAVAEAIWTLWNNGATIADIIQRYPLNRSTIYRILHGTSWRSAAQSAPRRAAPLSQQRDTFTPDQVREIRSLYADGATVPQLVIAFNSKRETIRDIVTRASWKNID